MIQELHQQLINREITACDLVTNYFEVINAKDPQVKAFLSLQEERAIWEAQAVDSRIKNGEKIGMLAGIPYALKDNILFEGTPTTAGSKMLAKYSASYDATVVRKLKEARAICLGKTNLDEFAMGSSTENSAFFTSHNPHNLDRVPGGSSGGSAAAVASGMTVFALGSDTAGSIRQPAAFCGLVGFKPTYGAISRFGLIAMASSLDVIGSLTQNVADARIIFQVLQGVDKNDSTSIKVVAEDGWSNGDNKKNSSQNIKIGLPSEFFSEGVSAEVKNAVLAGVNKLVNYGFSQEEINIPLAKFALPCYYIIMPAEVNSNLARYDGLRYASPVIPETNLNLSSIYLKNRGLGFGSEVKRRIILGTYVLSKGYYDAYYNKAQKVRKLIARQWEEVFERVNFVITPTTPTTAFKIGEKAHDPLAMYLSDVLTVNANLAGLPAISLPCGNDSEGLPIGLQILGPKGSDWQLLKVAEKIEGVLAEN